MEFLIVLAVLLVVAFVVTGPLRHEWQVRARQAGTPSDEEPARELAELEAARDAKYREIRDAELDHRTGKLSEEDYQALDASLRAEAVEILHQLDRVRGSDDAATFGGGIKDIRDPGDSAPPAHQPEEPRSQ